MTKQLSGVVFHPRIRCNNGAYEPDLPLSQKHLTEQQINDKLRLIFAQAGFNMVDIWNGIQINGKQAYNCNYFDIDLLGIFFPDFENIQKFFRSSRKAIMSDPVLHKLLIEYTDILLHCDHRSNMIGFSRCESSGRPNCEYCNSLPDIRAVKTNEIYKQNHNQFFTPLPDEPAHPNHYKTFIQLLEAHTEFAAPADAHLPSMKADVAFLTCPSKHHHFLSTSDTMHKRHMQIIHPGVRVTYRHICRFKTSARIECGLIFQSKRELDAHKTEMKHKVVRKRKSKPPAAVENNDVRIDESKAQNNDPEDLGDIDGESGDDVIDARESDDEENSQEEESIVEDDPDIEPVPINDDNDDEMDVVENKAIHESDADGDDNLIEEETIESVLGAKRPSERCFIRNIFN